MRTMNKKRPTAIKGTMYPVKTSFGTEARAGAIVRPHHFDLGVCVISHASKKKNCDKNERVDKKYF
jgi:hypothetical protein